MDVEPESYGLVESKDFGGLEPRAAGGAMIVSMGGITPSDSQVAIRRARRFPTGDCAMCGRIGRMRDRRMVALVYFGAAERGLWRVSDVSSMHRRGRGSSRYAKSQLMGSGLESDTPVEGSCQKHLEAASAHCSCHLVEDQ